MPPDNLFPPVELVIRSRRTCKSFDGRGVSKAEIARLLELAVMAPNHRLNEPWRFRVLTQPGIKRWIRNLQENIDASSLPMLQTSFDKVSTAGCLIFVSCERNENEVIDWENFAATCAGIQNLLLAATALRMQSYWSTGQIMTRPETFRFIDLNPQAERFAGTIWLGWGPIPEVRTRTPATEKTKWIE